MVVEVAVGVAVGVTGATAGTNTFDITSHFLIFLIFDATTIQIEILWCVKPGGRKPWKQK